MVNAFAPGPAFGAASPSLCTRICCGDRCYHATLRAYSGGRGSRSRQSHRLRARAAFPIQCSCGHTVPVLCICVPYHCAHPSRFSIAESATESDELSRSHPTRRVPLSPLVCLCGRRRSVSPFANERRTGQWLWQWSPKRRDFFTNMTSANARLSRSLLLLSPHIRRCQSRGRPKDLPPPQSTPHTTGSAANFAVGSDVCA
jgi:hypothetical protein